MNNSTEKKYYVTYFDKNYAIKGITLLGSIFKHDASSFVYVVCLDKKTKELLEKIAFKNLELISLEDIENSDDKIPLAREDRTLVEYYWTLTPCIIKYLLVQLPIQSVLTYIDSDMFFFHSPQIIFDEFADNDVYIHKHNFSESHIHLNKYGLYNVGIMNFRHSEKGLEVLDWWKKKCLACCKSELLPDDEVGHSYGDQKYLEYFDKIIDTVKIASSETIGVAPWNYSKYVSSFQDDTIFMEQQALIVFHFHSLILINTQSIIPHMYGYSINLDMIKYVYSSYFEALIKSYQLIKSIDSDFSYGFTPSKLKDEIYILTKKMSHHNFNTLGAKTLLEFNHNKEEYSFYFLSKRKKLIRKLNKILRSILSAKYLKDSFLCKYITKLYIKTKYSFLDQE